MATHCLGRSAQTELCVECLPLCRWACSRLVTVRSSFLCPIPPCLSPSYREKEMQRALALQEKQAMRLRQREAVVSGPKDDLVRLLLAAVLCDLSYVSKCGCSGNRLVIAAATAGG